MGIYTYCRDCKAGLTLSVSLMCIGSLIITYPPTYEFFGMLAPALLLFACSPQGLITDLYLHEGH